MTLSVAQRIQTFFVKVIINLLWFFDEPPTVKLRISYVVIPLTIMLFMVRPIKADLIIGNIFSNYAQQPFQSFGVQEAIKPYPTVSRRIPLPAVSAKSYIVEDVSSGKILISKNEKMSLAPASTTKLMTALVSLDLYSLDDTLIVTEECANVQSSKLWLPVGEEFSVEDLIYSSLIESAGDAACALSTGKVGYTRFVDLMNKKGAKLGLYNTNFTNPVGLDGYDGSHYSTAEDLCNLAKVIVLNPTIKKVVSTKDFNISSLDNNFKFIVHNTNRLLWEIPNSVGLKTGTTAEAGEVLVYEYNDGVKDIIIVVMGSSDRFDDTKNLLNWVLASYDWN